MAASAAEQQRSDAATQDSAASAAGTAAADQLHTSKGGLLSRLRDIHKMHATDSDIGNEVLALSPLYQQDAQQRSPEQLSALNALVRDPRAYRQQMSAADDKRMRTGTFEDAGTPQQIAWCVSPALPANCHWWSAYNEQHICVFPHVHQCSCSNQDQHCQLAGQHTFLAL